ncbi:TPA: hypothetical protein ACF9ZU_005100 [Escherichia coli]
MTTPSVLPQKLWRPLAEIKNFVEKMPDGVRLTEVTKKVKTFAELSGKERNQLIDFIDKRESIIVFKVRKEGSGNGVTFSATKNMDIPSGKETSQSLRTFNQNYVPDAGRQNQSMIFIQMPANVTGEPFIARSANLQ